jgi:P-type Ca2+ transporter type 2C
MWNAVACRSMSRPLKVIGYFSNMPLNISIGICLLGQLINIKVPFFQRIFQTTGLTFLEFFMLMVYTSCVILADEAYKFFLSKQPKSSKFVDEEYLMEEMGVSFGINM